jgi:hypothetical protein
LGEREREREDETEGRDSRIHPRKGTTVVGVLSKR